MAHRFGWEIEFGCRTDVGLRRHGNEDSYIVVPELGLLGVADGMGGHAGGKEASLTTVQGLREFFEWRLGDLEVEEGDETAWLLLMGEVVSEVNQLVFSRSLKEPSLKGMGTTLSYGLFYKKRLYVGHVGDSRLYRLRAGEISQLTEDHAMVQEMIRSGQIRTVDEAPSRYRSIVTRSVGFEDTVCADTLSLEVREGDQYLWCSDGLSNLVEDLELAHEMKANEPQKACEILVDKALANGGNDNITVIIAHVACSGV
ncbi:MAG: PP2C family serine/threonine-protein phosphatase [Myxococcota bacterium]|nr:PP2C family serine/threonine-protein phosphatase [Myxococcota bacterium]